MHQKREPKLCCIDCGREKPNNDKRFPRCRSCGTANRRVGSCNWCGEEGHVQKSACVAYTGDKIIAMRRRKRLGFRIGRRVEYVADASGRPVYYHITKTEDVRIVRGKIISFENHELIVRDVIGRKWFWPLPGHARWIAGLNKHPHYPRKVRRISK